MIENRFGKIKGTVFERIGCKMMKGIIINLESKRYDFVSHVAWNPYSCCATWTLLWKGPFLCKAVYKQLLLRVIRNNRWQLCLRKENCRPIKISDQLYLEVDRKIFVDEDKPRSSRQHGLRVRDRLRDPSLFFQFPLAKSSKAFFRLSQSDTVSYPFSFITGCGVASNHYLFLLP